MLTLRVSLLLTDLLESPSGAVKFLVYCIFFQSLPCIQCRFKLAQEIMRRARARKYIIVFLNERGPSLSLFFRLINYFKIFEYFSFSCDLFSILFFHCFINHLGIRRNNVIEIDVDTLFISSIILSRLGVVRLHYLMMHLSHLLYITSDLFKSFLITALEKFNADGEHVVCETLNFMFIWIIIVLSLAIFKGNCMLHLIVITVCFQ